MLWKRDDNGFKKTKLDIRTQCETNAHLYLSAYEKSKEIGLVILFDFILPFFLHHKEYGVVAAFVLGSSFVSIFTA